ncbi:hypothetical protein TTHERM_000157999 (macronuclear) [Tetrahymena thermophila SB210]|uniref:Uncharacterized protein n=1 Tax=Tetrahymena thermophila (strain SB210) TaxID=312017 RepID=W7XGB1_TETTS|nr:hypothetical protein TTHERM_000157999 [Tetrahymena thermophila SB210]EWS75978.1 hypothetical protein TTHERM_000157999 [Tetrahymena thermophila SB210]|eukprot:XP_012651496.1 hypothetical protein TTHERM_000157999 [Tetrahymena thermophila SB210]
MIMNYEGIQMFWYSITSLTRYHPNKQMKISDFFKKYTIMQELTRPWTQSSITKKKKQQEIMKD